eukprot:6189628-Pleurochrysis_carterae.AAC.2
MFLRRLSFFADFGSYLSVCSACVSQILKDAYQEAWERQQDNIARLTEQVNSDQGFDANVARQVLVLSRTLPEMPLTAIMHIMWGDRFAACPGSP